VRFQLHIKALSAQYAAYRRVRQKPQMFSFVLGLIGSILGVLVAAYVGRLLDKHFQLPASSSTSDLAIEYPHQFRLRIAVFFASLMLPSFFLLAATIVTVLATNWLTDSFAIFLFGIFLSTGFIFNALAVFLRCPKCQKHVLIQWISAPPHGEQDPSVDSGVSTVKQINRDGRFHCMYCGQKFQVNQSRLKRFFW
jgi:hypothetical protein